MARYSGGPVAHRALTGPRGQNMRSEIATRQELLYTLTCIRDVRAKIDATSCRPSAWRGSRTSRGRRSRRHWASRVRRPRSGCARSMRTPRPLQCELDGTGKLVVDGKRGHLRPRALDVDFVLCQRCQRVSGAHPHGDRCTPSTSYGTRNPAGPIQTLPDHERPLAREAAGREAHRRAPGKARNRA